MECLSIENSALFAGDNHLLVGRVYVQGYGHQALILDEKVKRAYLLGGVENESLYSVKTCPWGYAAVGHSGERALILLYKRNSLRAYLGPKGILWQTDCHIAVGGKEGRQWNLLIVDLKTKRGKVYAARGNIYAYSFDKLEDNYRLVGRVGPEGNYDGFVLTLGRGLYVRKALRSGWMENDYLRFVRKGIAVGRFEVGGNSEGFLFELKDMRTYLYRREGFDYFRQAYDGLIFGEAEDENGVRKALKVEGDQGYLFGEGFSAIRFYHPGRGRAYGYVYRGDKVYGLAIDGKGDKELVYRVETAPLRWKEFKLRRLSDVGFLSFTFETHKLNYRWKSCEELP
ncbi:MAG: hypothetical protein D6674_03845 [Acidobacteria bacterium]|jgi:hypothetical protein|nr:MAG: hypothetical protein D6674_03845 [Acidobacteriota bacterium]